MPQKKPRLTKREKKQLAPARPAKGGARGQQQEKHIHCTACGRHIEPNEFDEPVSATLVACQHGTQFASCTGCVARTKELLDEHDRTGEPVKPAQAWH